MPLSFEQIIAEAEETVARNKARVSKSTKAPVRAFEDPARENLYIPHRNVYNWFRNKCECGREWDEFDGIYEERRHQRLGHTHWIRLSTRPTNTLPRGSEYRDVEVPYCERCALNAPTKVTVPQPEDPCNASTGDNRQA